MKKTIFFTLVVLIAFGCTKLDEEVYEKIPGIYTRKMKIKLQTLVLNPMQNCNLYAMTKAGGFLLRKFHPMNFADLHVSRLV